MKHQIDWTSDDKDARENYKKTFRECKDYGNKILKDYIIQRQGSDHFFKHNIVKLPDVNIQYEDFLQFPKVHVKAIGELMRKSKADLSVCLKGLVGRWENQQADRRGERPNMGDAISGVSGDIGSNEGFYNLGLCARYRPCAIGKKGHASTVSRFRLQVQPELQDR
ncbi:uncharacterized protein BCR38DRAFT_483503 [Pseudomassariella vexata]|uniref:Uncharacterized protein n=1 Tax=Pseudomassariella vexata TaxID=1141098 RepID=A0A1Y2E4N5_9PEZI|nr:uncharacterized protein BCR38DRAFT_483503 [Pseudomassariella vexata]ORY65825.1 hypothetical protein BCR38DRAFT_483503 [Pseudomassariella vexata]